MTICLNLYGQNGSIEKYNFKNGIYLSIEEFKSDSPSLPLSSVLNESRDVLSSRLCTKKLEYIEEGVIQEIRSKDIWGVCINGNPYIRHQQGGIIQEQCFFKIFDLGAISRYFVQKVKTANNSMLSDPNTGFGPPTNNQAKLKILEFAIDLETGEKYNLKSEASKVIELIKKDNHFQNTKMKKKDVSIYITQHNKRNPIDITAE